MQAQEDKCRRLLRSLKALLRTIPVSSLTGIEHISEFEENSKELKAISLEFSIEVNTLTDDFSTELGVDRTFQWNHTLAEAENLVRTYRLSGITKCKDLKAADTTTPITTTASSSSESTVASELIQHEKNKEEKRLKKIRAEANANAAQIEDSLNSLILSYSSEYATPGDWEFAGDENAVEEAVGNIPNWTKEINSIKKSVHDLKAQVDGEDLDDLKPTVDEVKDKVAETDVQLEEVIKSIKDLNISLGVFAGMKPKSVLIKMKTFGGLDSEDFEVFQKNIEEAFTKNQIPRSDRIRHL